MSPETYLTSRLEGDITWRIRELSEIVRACADAKGVRKDALLRASVPVLYAHWEGFFVYAANSFLTFLTEKKIKISLLKNEFWVLNVRSRYKPQQISSDILFTRFLLDVRSDVDSSFKKGRFEKINGRSNLKSERLRLCCIAIGIDAEAYASYFNFIDEELIEKRNYIAHGSSLRFNEQSLSIYRENIIDLMRISANLIENSTATKAYLK